MELLFVNGPMVPLTQGSGNHVKRMARGLCNSLMVPFIKVNSKMINLTDRAQRFSPTAVLIQDNSS